MSGEHDGSSIDRAGLHALAELVRLRSVTKTAAALGLTQSGTSHLLRRLRARLGDPLLVRVRGGMAPTPRAAVLAARAEKILSDLRAFEDAARSWQPARARGTFRVALDDHMTCHLAPALLERVGARAPGIDLTIVRPPEDPIRALERDLDILVDLRQAVDSGLYDQILARYDFVVVCRRGHPRARGGIDLDAFCACEHVVVSVRLPSKSYVDDALEGLGRSRRIRARIPHFLAALAVVSRTEFLLTTTRALYETFGRALGLEAHPAPLPIPAVAVHQTWHERVHADPAHEWLRAQIRGALRRPT